MGGVASLIYGTLYHEVTVLEEKVVRIEVPLLTPFGPDEMLHQDLLEEESDPFDPLHDSFSLDDSDNAEATEEINPFETRPADGGAPLDEDPLGSETSATIEVNPFERPSAAREDPFQPGLAEGPPLSEQQPIEDTPWEGPAEEGLPPFMPAEPGFETVTLSELVSRGDLEKVLVREITFGGITRLANGQLKRTYSGKPPALCPT